MPSASDAASQVGRILIAGPHAVVRDQLAGEQSAQQRLAHHAGADDAEPCGALAITDTVSVCSGFFDMEMTSIQARE